MAGISRPLRNVLLIVGAVGAAEAAGIAWYIEPRLFRAEDGAPGITFELPPSVRHHVIFDRRGIEHREYFEGRLRYDAACGWVNDAGQPELEEPRFGCIENRYP